MSLPPGLTSGLAFLPAWLAEAKDSASWDLNLSSWVKASGWKMAGVVWPISGSTILAQQVRPEAVDTLPMLPPEFAEVTHSLPNSPGTVVWQLPGNSGRLYTLFQPMGRAIGAIWVERISPDPWTEADRQFLMLSVKLMERSSALAARIGPVVDPERLQQRLSDASVIAGRMAHDFDNILTGIIGFTDLSMPLVQPNSQPAKFLTEIGKVGHRGIQFTQQLHQLSRSGQAKPQPGQVLACLAKEETRLRGTAPTGPQIRIDIPTTCGLVSMEGVPLAGLLGHLLENAVEATPPHGTVRVSARMVDLTAAEARTYLGRAGTGPQVELTIQDSGTGIKPDVRAKLFVEPFFTTKVRHRGLGLAIAYRTLHAHGGGIRIDPVAPPETGTIVRVVLPPASRPPITTPRPLIVTKTAAIGG